MFTFGKELLIALCQSGSFKLTKRSRGYKPLGLRLAFLQPILCPKNERQKGKRRIFGCKMKYWMENILKKHQHFLVRTAERENKKQKVPANISSDFFVEIGKLIQVTKITRSNRDKSPYKS